MPRIAELREIEGEMWARLDFMKDLPSPVAFYTENELDKIKRAERLRCTTAIEELV